MTPLRAVAWIALACGLSACRGETSSKPPLLLERDMFVQARYEPQGYSRFFRDHGVMRPPVEATLPRESFVEDDEVATGVLADGSGYVLAVPSSVVDHAGGLEALATRGGERFGIYCTVCHGAEGDGKGSVNHFEGFPQIPTLLDEHVRHMADGQLYATIANGVRTMPPYGAQIPISDRWAIVAYVRALELHYLAQGTTP